MCLKVFKHHVNVHTHYHLFSKYFKYSYSIFYDLNFYNLRDLLVNYTDVLFSNK
ncbi:hypothetical protein BC781_102694 [Sediminitomix flava]|uniref:Uncharacterized protein n=1 Tax=Sediminitomix flava TaxID=379075 RepID=A0A315ZC43_SEDFL|nr:hypothetical protein BC781_102694 [Sediminitomix flava]